MATNKKSATSKTHAKPIAASRHSNGVAKPVAKPSAPVKPNTEKEKMAIPTLASTPASALPPNSKTSDKKGMRVTKGTAKVEAAPLPKADAKLEKNLAASSTGALQSPLRIFQIYKEAWQRDLLDRSFIALDNMKINSEMQDFEVLRQLEKSDYILGAKLWGALSWRFTERTGMTGADLIKSIESNPGFDVYYCNPAPQTEGLFHNLWLHGETAHPQFLALSQALFKTLGLPEQYLTSIVPSEHFATANYFIGTPKFWAAYIPWIINLFNTANKKLPPAIRDLMHSKTADPRDKEATYVPFLIERLFPIFLMTAGKNLKTFKIALPKPEAALNVHLKLLREMKDVAVKTKSAWLAACWVNYRNLYLTQVNGKEWCLKYLRQITPTDIKFL